MSSSPAVSAAQISYTNLEQAYSSALAMDARIGVLKQESRGGAYTSSSSRLAFCNSCEQVLKAEQSNYDQVSGLSVTPGYRSELDAIKQLHELLVQRLEVFVQASQAGVAAGDARDANLAATAVFQANYQPGTKTSKYVIQFDKLKTSARPSPQ